MRPTTSGSSSGGSSLATEAQTEAMKRGFGPLTDAAAKEALATGVTRLNSAGALDDDEGVALGEGSLAKKINTFFGLDGKREDIAYLTKNQVGSLQTAMRACVASSCTDDDQLKLFNAFKQIAQAQGAVAPLDSRSYGAWRAQLDSIPESVDLGIDTKIGRQASAYFSTLNKSVQPSWGMDYLMMLADTNFSAGGSPAKSFAVGGLLNAGAAMLNDLLKPTPFSTDSSMLNGKIITHLEIGEQRIPIYSDEGLGAGIGSFNEAGRMKRTEFRTVFNQGDTPTCVPTSVRMIMDTLGGQVDVDPLLAAVRADGLKGNRAAALLQEQGIDARFRTRLTIDDLAKATANGAPALAAVRLSTGEGHAIVIDGVTKTADGVPVVAIRDPHGKQYFEKVEVFQQRFLRQGIFFNSVGKTK